jgi:hypothetical protein
VVLLPVLFGFEWIINDNSKWEIGKHCKKNIGLGSEEYVGVSSIYR